MNCLGRSRRSGYRVTWRPNNRRPSARILGQGAASEARAQWYEGLANVYLNFSMSRRIMTGFIINPRITGLCLIFKGPCVRHAAAGPLVALAGTRCFLLDLTKAALGRHLFNEPRLSYDKTVSYAGCHNPDYGGADGARDTRGSGGTSRTTDTPTMVNKDLNVLSVSNSPAARMCERSAKGNATATDEHPDH